MPDRTALLNSRNCRINELHISWAWFLMRKSSPKKFQLKYLSYLNDLFMQNFCHELAKNFYSFWLVEVCPIGNHKLRNYVYIFPLIRIWLLQNFHHFLRIEIFALYTRYILSLKKAKISYLKYWWKFFAVLIWFCLQWYTCKDVFQSRMSQIPILKNMNVFAVKMYNFLKSNSLTF